MKLLLAVTFNSKKVCLLVQKIERLLNDFDYLYVNILEMLRHPEASKLQKAAQDKLSKV